MEFFQLKRGYTSVAETPAVLQSATMLQFLQVVSQCNNIPGHKNKQKKEINLAKPVSNYAKKREKNIKFTCASLINMPFLTLGSPTR